MRFWIACVVAAACSKSPPHAPEGSGSAAVVIAADARIADASEDPRSSELVGAGEAIPGGLDTVRTTPEPVLGPRPPPHPRIGLVAKQKLDTTSSLTVEAVTAKLVGPRLLEIKPCYVDYLKKHPDAAGIMTLTFVVNDAGRATEVDAQGIGSELESCTEAHMTRWRFDEPKTAAGDPAEARFRFEMTVAPD